MDSTVLVDLIFNHPEERKKALVPLADLGSWSSSHYVIFEIARGYFCSLLILYNKSWGMDGIDQLHKYSHEGQQIYKRYRRECFLGVFDSYMAWARQQAGSLPRGHELAWISTGNNSPNAGSGTGRSVIWLDMLRRPRRPL